jgi:hypothetical protein
MVGLVGSGTRTNAAGPRSSACQKAFPTIANYLPHCPYLLGSRKESTMAGEMFYSTPAWRKLRAEVKKKWRAMGLPCAVCGQPLVWGGSEARGAVIVDHIMNRKKYPHLALEPTNTQCVCHACNTKKAAYVEHNDREPIDDDGYPASWR